MLILHWKQWNK